MHQKCPYTTNIVTFYTDIMLFVFLFLVTDNIRKKPNTPYNCVHKAYGRT